MPETLYERLVQAGLEAMARSLPPAMGAMHRMEPGVATGSGGRFRIEAFQSTACLPETFYQVMYRAESPET